MNRTLKKLAISIMTAVVAMIGLAAAPARAEDRNVLLINETRHKAAARLRFRRG